MILLERVLAQLDIIITHTPLIPLLLAIAIVLPLLNRLDLDVNGFALYGSSCLFMILIALLLTPGIYY